MKKTRTRPGMDQRLRNPLIAVFSLLACICPGLASADIYRFVTVDGVETFTDTPVNNQAQIHIRDSRRKVAKAKKQGKPESQHVVSINEVVEKTITASLNPPEQMGHGDRNLPNVGGTITSVVGMRTDPIDGKLRHHNGIDIAIGEGTPVPAVAAGTVLYSGFRTGYGNTVLIQHPEGIITLYGHNSRLMVTAGDTVRKGTTIALSGNTGRSTGPHLHFEAWQAGVNITPAFLPGSNFRTPEIRVASTPKTKFRKVTLDDGTILFTNLP